MLGEQLGAQPVAVARDRVDADVQRLLMRRPAGALGSGIDGACTALHRPARCRSISPAKAFSALREEARGAVGMAAGAAVGHVGAPAQQPRQLLRARGAACHEVEGVGDGAQAEQARSALAGALGGEVVQDARGLLDAAGARPRTQSTPAPIEPALRSGSPSLR